MEVRGWLGANSPSDWLKVRAELKTRAERGNGSYAALWQGSPGAVGGRWWQYQALRSRRTPSRGYWPSGRAVTNSKVSISTR